VVIFTSDPPSHTVELERTKSIIENVPIMHLGGAHHIQEGLNEAEFWDDLIHRKLKPVTVRFTLIDDIKDMLKSLHNSILAVLLLINLTWIILYTRYSFLSWKITGWSHELSSYFSLLFIALSLPFSLWHWYATEALPWCITLVVPSLPKSLDL